MGTVTTLCILNVGTVPTFSPSELVPLNDLHYLSLRRGTLNGSHGAGRFIPLRAVGALEGCRSPPGIAIPSTASAMATNSDLLLNELVDNVVKEGSILGSILGSI